MAPKTWVVDRRQAGPPFAVGVLSVLGTLPVVTALEPLSGVPRWLTVFAVIGFGVVGVAFSSAAGATLARDVGLRTLDTDRLPDEGLRTYRLPAVAGVGVALFSLGVHAGASSLGLDPLPTDRWAGAGSLAILVSVAGSVVTELVLRFGFMTLVMWAAWTARPRIDGGVARTSAWVGIVAAALLGAFLTVPAAVAGGATPVTVAVTALVPLVAGVVFGTLYWRYDLAAAIVAHAVASLLRTLTAVLL